MLRRCRKGFEYIQGNHTSSRYKQYPSLRTSFLSKRPQELWVVGLLLALSPCALIALTIAQFLSLDSVLLALAYYKFESRGDSRMQMHRLIGQWSFKWKIHPLKAGGCLAPVPRNPEETESS